MLPMAKIEYNAHSHDELAMVPLVSYVWCRRVWNCSAE